MMRVYKNAKKNIVRLLRYARKGRTHLALQKVKYPRHCESGRARKYIDRQERFDNRGLTKQSDNFDIGYFGI